MRAALWIAILIAAFVLAWRIQERWSADRREERDAAYARPSDEALPEGFSRAVVGRPSGAAAVEVPPASRTSHASEPSGGETHVPDPQRTGSPGITPKSGDGLRRYVVADGDSLSKICAAVYGTARKEVVDAVARANGLADPGSIRVGQHLVLPPIADVMSVPR